MDSTPNYRTTWDSIVESPDKAAATRQHLASFLTESPECEDLLDRLMSRFRGVRVENDHLQVDFLNYLDDLDTLCLNPPYLDTDPPADLPPSLLAVLRVHNDVWWGDGAESIGFSGVSDGVFGGSGGWDPSYLEDDDEFLAQVTEAGLHASDVHGLCDFGQDWLIWHPVERGPRDEPTVYYVSHEGGDPQRYGYADEFGFGAMLLRMMVDSIVDD